MTYHPIPFDTPIDLLLAARPHFRPYAWQAEDLLWLAGYRNPISSTDFGERTHATGHNPATYILQASNSAGKDSVIGAGFMMWFIATKPRSKVICTSASAQQMHDQTEKPCRVIADALNPAFGNRFRYVQRSVIDTVNGSEIIFFATDDPGKAEGNHPNDDYPAAEMAELPSDVSVSAVIPLDVPGLGAERHLILLAPAGSGS